MNDNLDADAIRALVELEAENARLRGALLGVLDAFDSWYTYKDRPSHPSEKIRRRELGAKRVAAFAVLDPSGEPSDA